MRIPREEHGLRDRLGMVIPAWFAADLDPAVIHDLLSHTLAGSDRLVAPTRLVLVVDGCPHVEAVARELQAQWQAACEEPFTLLALPHNQGKAAAVAAGLAHLDASDFPRWVVVRDSDGDHRVDDVARLVTLGEEIAAQQDTDLVAVTGGRTSPHRAMNWLRGELELWLDEVALEGCKLARAAQGEVLPTQYWAAYDAVPDLESGFKLFSAAAARLALQGLREEPARHPDLDLPRWGCEIIPLVELLLAGGVVGEVRRLSWEGQPVSGYEGDSGVTLYEKQMAWLLRRLGLPRPQAARLLDNALLRRPLWSDGRGRQVALDLRREVLEALPGEEPVAEPRLGSVC